MEVINAIGRRKAAVARVYLSEGKGNITINNRKMEDFLILRIFYMFGFVILSYVSFWVYCY